MVPKQRTADEWAKLLRDIAAAEGEACDTHGCVGFPQTYSSPGALQVLSFSADPDTFKKPCIECGLITGNFCDGQTGECFAKDTIKDGKFEPGQRTPMCTKCEKKYRFCKVCRDKQRSEAASGPVKQSQV